jgi:chromosome segregation ATPase
LPLLQVELDKAQGGGQATTNADLSAVKVELNTLKTDNGNLKTELTTLKTDVTALKTDKGKLQTDINTLKALSKPKVGYFVYYEYILSYRHATLTAI